MSNREQVGKENKTSSVGKSSGLKRRSLKKWVPLVLVLGVLSAVFGARPFWNYFEEQKAVKIAETVEGHLATGDFQTAYREASRAYQLAPEHQCH